MKHIRLFENFGGKTILYIHGWESSPHKDRIEMMIGICPGLTVIAPTFDYKEKPVWDELCDTMETKKPDAIIGFSMGGYLGYHLSNKYKVHALLYSPAIVRNQDGSSPPLEFQPVPKEVRTLPPFKERIAVISPNDNMLNYADLKKALEGKLEVIIDPDMEHRTPKWALEKYFKVFAEKYLA
jgi:esterase/lipase